MVNEILTPVPKEALAAVTILEENVSALKELKPGGNPSDTSPHQGGRADVYLTVVPLQDGTSIVFRRKEIIQNVRNRGRNPNEPKHMEVPTEHTTSTWLVGPDGGRLPGTTARIRRQFSTGRDRTEIVKSFPPLPMAQTIFEENLRNAKTALAAGAVPTFTRPTRKS